MNRNNDIQVITYLNNCVNFKNDKSIGLNFISLYKYTIAKLQALKWIVTSFIQKGFRRKSIDFCELYP